MATPGLPKPPITVDLTWQAAHRFAARVRSGDAAGVDLVLDGDGRAGPSPVQALALGLASCMATDVVDILVKGRHRVAALTAHLVGDRRAEPPTRFTRFHLHFVVGTDAPDAAIERAIALGRETYCSVWHSLRPDLDFRTTFERRPP